MKSFLQLMPVLLSFYFLSSSVSCAVDANEYLKSDMFDFSFNRLNNVSEGTEYGLTLTDAYDSDSYELDHRHNIYRCL